ncbi:MAG TPA: TerC/Alx family metal homeostasis membrane protein [Saprospiraceae bacterium]|nr:TerC/Alx family metal homeostasis membrane protein [Saprospiraceae bacterium]
MTTDELMYLIFGIVILLALVFDLGLISKTNKKITIRQALYQTLFWVSLAMGFFVFMWNYDSQFIALAFLSAYLMEWSLSIDNIFVFILIFSAFSVKPKHYGRVLLIGILMAIVLRVIFITVGVALVEKFHWILYVFGAFLVFTGIKMFLADEEDEFDPLRSKTYKFLKRIIPLAPHDGDGKFSVIEDGKRRYTTLFIVVLMLATIDVVFALDSIPAVMGISTDRMVIYTSNIFALLGLRSLFFLLRSAVSKFDYLPQGISIVLVFIGLKMLGEHWITPYVAKNTQVLISLLFIVVCLSGSVLYSLIKQKKGIPQDATDADSEDSKIQ